MRWQKVARLAIAAFVIVFAGVVFVALRRPAPPKAPITSPRTKQDTVAEVSGLDLRHMSGDRLVFVLSYRNNGAAPATDFVITNPIPDSVEYAGTQSAGAVHSIDGGRNWGALDALSVRDAQGNSRAATFADVTHVRWRFVQPIPAGSGGEVRFRGVVK